MTKTFPIPIAAVPALLAGAAVRAQDVVDPRATALEESVVRFFQTDHAEEREKLANDIRRQGGEDVDRVARAIRAAGRWAPVARREGEFTVEAATDGAASRVRVHYQLDADYDPRSPHPLLVCMPQTGLTPRDVMNQAGRRLGLSFGEEGVIAVCLGHPVSGAYHPTPETAGSLHEVLREIRRRFHTNVDRTYLFGAADGGEAVWTAAIFHPDLFAGVVVFDAAPRVPYPEQLLPLLLPNLASLPVVVGRGSETTDFVGASAERTDGALRRIPFNALADYEGALLGWASERSLPIRRIAEGEPIPSFLPITRNAHPPRIDHRFPSHAPGQAYWMQATGLARETWPDVPLSILPAPGVDADRFVRDVLASTLSRVTGEMASNTIHLETRGCTEIALSLPIEAVDLRRPLLLRCNGVKRFDGLVKPNIQTMLDQAHRTWDFTHPVVAQIVLRIQGDAK